jgi:integrase
VNGADVFIGSFDTVEDAHTAREERKTAARGGQPVVAKSRLRLNDAKTLYFTETASDWKDSTRRSAESRYKAHVAEALGDVPLRDLTFERLSTFRKELVEKEGISGQTRREVLLLVRSILRDCVRRSYIAVNPAELLNLPSKDASIVTVPPYDVAIAAVAAVKDPMARMVADLILNTGLRINEALGLTWPDLDLVARKLVVQRSIDQKSGKIVLPKTPRSIRRIDLPGGFVTRLTAYAEAQQTGAVLRNVPWVFPATERPVDPTSGARPPVLNDRNFMQRHWAPARTGVTPLRFGMHALRHLYATRLLQKGATLKYVSEQLGHTSAAFTMTQYIHFLPEHDEQRGWLSAAFD